jgi:hypothetical protein
MICSLTLAHTDQLCIMTNSHAPIRSDRSALALSKILDAFPHKEQDVALCHLGTLGKTLTAYPASNIRLR